MKYLVGETANGTEVFAFMGKDAVSLTAIDASVGRAADSGPSCPLLLSTVPRMTPSSACPRVTRR